MGWGKTLVKGKGLTCRTALFSRIQSFSKPNSCEGRTLKNNHRARGGKDSRTCGFTVLRGLKSAWKPGNKGKRHKTDSEESDKWRKKREKRGPVRRWGRGVFLQNMFVRKNREEKRPGRSECRLKKRQERARKVFKQRIDREPAGGWGPVVKTQKKQGKGPYVGNAGAFCVRELQGWGKFGEGEVRNIENYCVKRRLGYGTKDSGEKTG